MKTSKRRSAISQSMDLFIIIAAVLGVGGVVTASVYNLVSSATSNSSVSIVGASLKAGPGASSPPTAITVTVKNDGGSPISCGTSTSCEVVFADTNTGSTVPSCASPCSINSGGLLQWSVNTSPGALTFDLSNAPVQLPAGAETSFVLNGPLVASSTASFWAAGSPVTVNVLFGAASAQVTVISQ